jgi:putative transcriptional regulator|tara:strand:- start:6 stop:239 length:234 start_codon:yes stop_codon:yes gene_type:complete
MVLERSNMGNHLELVNHLKEWRKKSALTQAQLAEAVDVSRKSINAVENGVYIPSTVLALKIAKSLNCTVHDLFELTE